MSSRHLQVSSRRTTEPPKDIHDWIFQEYQKSNYILHWQDDVFWNVFDLEEEATCPQKDLSSRQHSWHCHSSSGMFKDPVAMFWKLSAIDFAFDLGNKRRKFRAVVAMKHFLLRSVKNSTITWITSAVLGWCGKGSFWGCGGVCAGRGDTGMAFETNIQELSHVWQNQFQSAPGQSHPWLRLGPSAIMAALLGKKPCGTEAGREEWEYIRETA